MIQEVRADLIRILERERETVEHRCTVIDGVDVYQNLVELFQSDQSALSVLGHMNRMIGDHLNRESEFLYRVEMSEDNIQAQDEKERAYNQFLQVQILKSYRNIWQKLMKQE
ncbi:hypothetical protein [Staphylococcus pettenkoferi]|uniref:hypothetical protein n=1 Tax=Staphylococcus pettenkoferi TaxID=170573 RepID=UPI0025530D11|nr:hypothetical protein [Staphylococcus pettenkoferi]MDK7284457.1 hypothetical protein [Staphylococcus pettenkoferi]